MKYYLIFLLSFFIITSNLLSQELIPLDTSKWNVQAQAYMFEQYEGKEAIYMKGGSMALKDVEFLNGTIEFDVYLREEWSFPGLYFRLQQETASAEQFYIRPHLSGKPDANQVAPMTQGITAWQLYFGPKYSFTYEYNYDDWTHVKIMVNGNRAQIYLDHSKEPQLSWNLFLEEKKGAVILTAGRLTGMHIADVKIDHSAPKLYNFKPIEREPIADLIQEWTISDKFEETLLSDHSQIKDLISERKWQGNVKVEEGTAANISRLQMLRNNVPGNTVFAKVNIKSEKDQIKLFEFGYSDRVVTILNGQPIYQGTNKWKSRDYRYLGTIGLFDAVYLPLKKGNNELIMAVSEDFGGWLITGKFKDYSDINVEMENL